MNRRHEDRLLASSKGSLLVVLLLGVLLVSTVACGGAPAPQHTSAVPSIPIPSSTVIALPDLVATIKGPASAAPGQALGDSIIVEVTNQGRATARNFSVGLYFSADRTVDQRDSLLLGGREFVKSLGPGETVTVKLSGANTLPEGLLEGPGYLGVIVDETDAVEELDKDNNTARWLVAIRVVLTPTPTPRPTRTSTPTDAVSPSPSPTEARPTPTSTATAAASPTVTPKPARTFTPTATASPSPSRTSIPTPTTTPAVIKTPTRVLIKTPTAILPAPEALRVVTSAPLPGSQAAGLAWGDGWLWVSDAVERQVYAVDPLSGKILSSMPAEAASPRGLAWDGAPSDGGVLWVADHGGKRLIYLMIPAKGGFPIDVIPAPGKNSAPCGLAYGGKSLWVSHGCARGDETDTIYQIDPWDGTVINAFPAPGDQPEGLAFVDGLLWNVDGSTGTIYGLDPDSGQILARGAVSGVKEKGSLVGLAFDGSYLWVNDALNVYQVKP